MLEGVLSVQEEHATDMQDLGLTANRYIQAMEIKPIKGVKVVHHVESSLIDPDDESQAGRQHPGSRASP